MAPAKHEGEPIKGNRFVALASPVASEAEAHEFIAKARVEHPGCRHCCWAFRLADGNYRSSDDGEPGGSAGRPLLAQLEGAGLVDACVVVVRFSSGIKLGVGGLIRAYGGAVRELLPEAKIEEEVPMVLLVVHSSWADQAIVERTFANDVILERSFGADVVFSVRVPAESASTRSESLRESSAGRVRVESKAEQSPIKL